ALEQDEGGVIATLNSPSGQEQVRCLYLVGCDGAHSMVRRTLGIPFEGDAYPATYILVDADVSGPIAPDETHTFHVGSEYFVAVPIRGQGRFRLATEEHNPQTAGQVEHGLFAGEGTPPTLEQMQAIVDRLGPPGMVLSNPRWTSRFRISRRL